MFRGHKQDALLDGGLEELLFDLGFGKKMVLGDQYLLQIFGLVNTDNDAIHSYETIKGWNFSPTHIFDHAVPGELGRVLLKVVSPEGCVVADTETFCVVKDYTLFFQSYVLVVSSVRFVKEVHTETYRNDNCDLN
jgi:hypothetical protein